jgi:hypothetical protein
VNTVPQPMSEQAVADLLGIKLKTFRNRKALGDAPVSVKLSSRTSVYLPDDVAAYIHGKRFDPATKPVPAVVPAAKAAAVRLEPVKRKPGRPKGSFTRR